MRFAPYLGPRLSSVLLVPWALRAQLRALQRFQGATVSAIGGALRLPADRALRVYRASLRTFVRFNLQYLFLCRSSSAAVRARMAAIEVRGQEHLTPFLTDGRPVLLITMHMGEFQLGFLKLAASLRSKRNIFAFKISERNADEDALFAAFARESQHIEPLRAGQDGGRRAYLELRKGNVVMMTVDLEVHVTSRSTVEFFGRPCQMQNGPATLALLTGAVIVPIINYTDAAGVDTVRVETPLDTKAQFTGEPPRAIIDRLTQQIATLMQTWIAIDPTQVHAWSAIAETIHHRPATIKAAACD